MCPTDKNLHTNWIEGLWNKFKRWLPQAGNYNLEEYLHLFMWMEEQKLLGHDPFWALVALVLCRQQFGNVEGGNQKAGDHRSRGLL